MITDFQRVYAIGDIHGRSDLLDRMAAAIERDLKAVRGEECLTVSLGDYVDRGPDSRGVLDRLSRNPFPTPYIGLKGNHEAMFQSFLRAPAIGPHWYANGGDETMRSYEVPADLLGAGKVEEAAQTLRAALPSAHGAFLSALRYSLDLGPYFLCHAGIRPGVPFDRQNPEDLTWIREEFLMSRMNFGKIVVHGHTPVPTPEVRRNRINVDTGAFASGLLTCVVLGTGEPRFLFAD